MKMKMGKILQKGILLFFSILIITVNTGCEKREPLIKKSALTLGVYTVPKEAYQKAIIPAFKRYWRDKTGEEVEFYESYVASGAQSRAIIEGFDADIAALSLEQHVNKLTDAGLITHDWRIRPYNGFITRSVVVIGFRGGNPKNIYSWEDLTRYDVMVLYPSPKTSGGAMWDINAIYGAALKESEVKNGKKDFGYAASLLKSIQARVKVMDKSGRESLTTFETGIGDAIVTYENEILLRHKQGNKIPFILPDATILIENPVALIDKNVDKHGNRRVAEEFINFLYSKTAQDAFAEYGFRPVNEEVMKVYEQKYPAPKYLFDINYLGGWDRVAEEIYGETGIWSKIMKELARK